MNNTEIMDLSINDWIEISHHHPVTCEQMEIFLEDIISKQETPEHLEKGRRELRCQVCHKLFTRSDNLKRHMKAHTIEKEFECSFCPQRFHRLDKKKEHELDCNRVSIMVDDSEKNDSRSSIQRGGGMISEEKELENDGCETAIKGQLKTILIKPRGNAEKYDLLVFLQGKQANVLQNLERELKERRGLKWFITVQARMVKYRAEESDQFTTPHFRSQCERLLNIDELSQQYQESIEKVKESFQSYQREGSGWQLQEVRIFCNRV